VPDSVNTSHDVDVQPADERNSPQRSFRIHSLRPEYKANDHQLYVEYIRTELDKPARAVESSSNPREDESLRPRNIALTGGYGSGKSSVLGKIVGEYADRIVSVSLSTLGSEAVKTGPDSSDTTPLETSPITNAIQKEVVKQLLYREKPSKVPGSRYRRIEAFRRVRSILLSALIGAGFAVIGFISSWLSRIEVAVQHNGWFVLLAYFGLFVIISFVAYGLQWFFHNRLRIDKVTSGPASVSLTDKSESFFDKYLDEIVYFFEATVYDVVIFEDIDRFNDPYIFETLRELNTLLNSSKQIEPKTITFIYAIKDSIFEQLGKLSINGVQLTDDEIRQLAVTNRTKFFDVVIPVVPFISQRNSRDLVGQQMNKSGFTVDRVLADLVSKHLVDMRLIKNIHNEFAVFEQKILGPKGVKELNRQSLFAMVVYKNLHMTDFEKIKEGKSNLDDVFADYRILVNREIAQINRDIRSAELKLHNLNSTEARSKSLARQLDDFIQRILGYVGSSIDQASFTLSSDVSREDLGSTAFWEEWLADEDLSLTISYTAVLPMPSFGNPSGILSITLTLKDLRQALNDSLALSDWEKGDGETLKTEIERLTTSRDFLKHAKMEQVAAHPEYKLGDSADAKSFVELAEDRLGAGVALDLIRAGFIDRNFSLYVSLYYDDTVTARARNYLLHSVETNVMDVNAEIGTRSEIEAMLIEAGQGVFAEQSIFNIQIFDYLLEKRDARLHESVALLTLDRPERLEFLAAYFTNGAHVQQFVAELAPQWPRILTFLHTDNSVKEEERKPLLDEAMASLSDDLSYDASSGLGTFIQSDWRSFSTLTKDGKAVSPDTLIDVLDAADVEFDVLADVAPNLQPGVVTHRLYALTSANLTTALHGEDNLALDRVRSLDADVFKYLAANLSSYVEIQAGSPSTLFTIEDRTNFVETINELTSSSVDDLRSVVEGSIGLSIVRLTALNEKIWPLVAWAKKLTANFANVTAYIKKLGAIDDDLGVTLEESESISDLDDVDEVEQRELALSIINSHSVRADQRIKLVKSLDYSQPLLVTEIIFDGSEPAFVGDVLTSGLIVDEAESFEQLGDLPWDAKNSFILASSKFVNYIDEIDFTVDDLQSLVQDDETPDEVKAAVLANLASFTSSLNKAALAALAQFAISSGTSIGGTRILTMATARIDSDLIVRLLLAESTPLTLDDLLAVLRVMPEQYGKLASVNGSTRLPKTEADLWLADRLVELDQVSSRDPEPKGNDFRVNLHRTA
jgi:hypothetical protein